MHVHSFFPLFSNRNSLELALSRPITVMDNERFTVQSVITKLVCPVVLVSSSHALPQMFRVTDVLSFTH